MALFVRVHVHIEDEGDVAPEGILQRRFEIAGGRNLSALHAERLGHFDVVGAPDLSGFREPGIAKGGTSVERLHRLSFDPDRPVVEDDPYGHLIYEEVDVKPLKAYDRTGRVIYISSFSKVLAPGLRLGFVIAKPEIVRWLVLAKQAVNLQTSTFTQYIAYEALRRGVIDRNIQKVKVMYKRKRDLMLKALEEYMPNYVTWTKPIGGMFIWVTVPEKLRTEDMLMEAIQKYKVAYVPGVQFYPDEDVHNNMRLNFSYPTEEQIPEGIRRLAKLIEDYMHRI